MQIALVGYGAMGVLVAEAAKERGHDITKRIDPHVPGVDATEISAAALAATEVIIDFSAPASVLQNIEKYCSIKKPVVMGTTGWYAHTEKVHAMVKEAGCHFLWSSNFSLGVNLYFRIIEQASRLMAHFDEYDVWGYEIHHHHKADSPSGTAKTLSEIILKNDLRKKKAIYEKLDRKINRDEFHFASVRGGPVNFEHTIGFDSAEDAIIIKHAARNRQGYARGAVRAAEWLLKQAPGFYGFEDFLSEVLK